MEVLALLAEKVVTSAAAIITNAVGSLTPSFVQYQLYPNETQFTTNTLSPVRRSKVDNSQSIRRNSSVSKSYKISSNCFWHLEKKSGQEKKKCTQTRLHFVHEQ
jgi:hypothetical protein